MFRSLLAIDAVVRPPRPARCWPAWLLRLVNRRPQRRDGE